MTDSEKLEAIADKCEAKIMRHALFRPWNSLDDAMLLIAILKTVKRFQSSTVHIEDERASCYIWETDKTAAPTWSAFDPSPARAVFEAAFEACHG